MRRQVYTLGGMDYVEFQQEAVHKLLRRSKEILGREEEQSERDKRMLLYSPVGSGKTVIGTAYMEYLAETIGEEVAFVWLSSGEGGLHTQSEDSTRIMSKELQVIDVQKVLTQKELQSKDVLFMNWESLRQEDNVLRRVGEQTNLAECIENTKDIKIVVMVDEAHRARNKEVIDLFNPSLVVDITATPKLNRYKEDNIIEVDIQAVINEGIIKKQTHINVGIASNDADSLLEEAIKKREEIEKRFKETTNNKEVPLVLIQVENQTRAGAKRDSKTEVDLVDKVKEKLISEGIDEDKIGVWLSERHENIEEAIKTSDIEYLIFKQAIATGWNCPRSHILVRLRDIKTETFDLQTIGRILRTVERKHYGDDLLDTAYIFTEYETVSYKPTPEFADKVLTEENRAELREDFKEEIGTIRLPMRKIKQALNYVVDTNKLREYLKRGLDNQAIKTMEIKENYLEGNFESVKMESGEILTEGVGEVKTVQTYQLSQYRIDKLYKGYIRKLYPKMDISRIITTVISQIQERKYNAADIRKLYVSNRVEIEGYIQKAIREYEAYARGKISSGEEVEYEIQEEVFYPNISPGVENYTYTKKPNLEVQYTRSLSEEPFGAWLDEQENVLYWYKNGTSQSDFSIVYIDTDEMHKEYYPDFVVITEEEGERKLYILDVKGTFEGGDIDKEQVALKYEAGRVYEQEVTEQGLSSYTKGIETIEVSMVKYSEKDMKTPFICKAEEYTEDITGWSPLEV